MLPFSKCTRITSQLRKSIRDISIRHPTASTRPRRVGKVKHYFHSSATKNQEIKFVVEDGEGEEYKISMWPGDKLHDAILDAGMELECACDGEAMCSTCHCIFESQDVFDQLPPAEEEEEDMLDLALELTDTSRLSCQISYQKELDGCRIRLPKETSNYY